MVSATRSCPAPPQPYAHELELDWLCVASWSVVLVFVAVEVAVLAADWSAAAPGSPARAPPAGPRANASVDAASARNLFLMSCFLSLWSLAGPPGAGPVVSQSAR